MDTQSSENPSATAGKTKIKSGFKNYRSCCPADRLFTIIFLKHSWLQIKFIHAKAGTTVNRFLQLDEATLFEAPKFREYQCTLKDMFQSRYLYMCVLYVDICTLPIF